MRGTKGTVGNRISAYGLRPRGIFSIGESWFRNDLELFTNSRGGTSKGSFQMNVNVRLFSQDAQLAVVAAHVREAAQPKGATGGHRRR